MINYEELAPEHWTDLAALFGRNGAQAGCWCMWWRVERGGKLWDETAGRRARDRMRRLVKGGRALGILAFDDETPVGWCSFGPRAAFRGWRR